MYRVTNNESDRPQPTALDQFRFQFPFPDRLRIDRYTCTCCCLSVCLSIRSVGSGRWACKQQQDATVQYCTVLCVVQQSIYVINPPACLFVRLDRDQCCYAMFLSSKKVCMYGTHVSFFFFFSGPRLFYLLVRCITWYMLPVLYVPVPICARTCICICTRRNGLMPRRAGRHKPQGQNINNRKIEFPSPFYTL